MPNVMAAQPNIGGTLFPNFIPCSTPQSLADVRYWSAVQWRYQYRRTQDLDAKWILHVAKFRQGARAPENVYIVPAQKTSKDRAKFGWPPVSDVAAVTKPRRENQLKFSGVPLRTKATPYVEVW